MLFVASVLWGTAFVFQSTAMDRVGPYAFNVCRFLLGALVLSPVAFFTCRKQRQLMLESGAFRGPADVRRARGVLWKAGFLCGICIFFAGSLQQVGLVYTTPAKSGFITAMYIILVPIFSLFLGRKCPRMVWLAVALSILGLYLLCIREGSPVNRGDLITLGSSVMFACQILTVDHYIDRVNGVALSCIQFLVAGVISILPAVIFEADTTTAADLWAVRGSIFFLGVFSSGIAYTLQIIGQKGLNPTVASLIMSLESANSAIAGWLILGQKLTGRELAGCLVMFAAIILAQMPDPGRKV